MLNRDYRKTVLPMQSESEGRNCVAESHMGRIAEFLNFAAVKFDERKAREHIPHFCASVVNSYPWVASRGTFARCICQGNLLDNPLKLP
jgi:hypothetical protein